MSKKAYRIKEAAALISVGETTFKQEVLPEIRINSSKTLAIALILAGLLSVTATTANAATVEATAYCDHGLMADGGQTKPGVAAVPEGTLPLGTKITLTKPVFGRVKYTVRDHIGAYSQLDLWTPDCGTAWAFGRRTITYRVGWPRYKQKATLTGEGRVRNASS